MNISIPAQNNVTSSGDSLNHAASYVMFIPAF